MGLFGGKKKDAGKVAASSNRKTVVDAPLSTRKSVRRVVPSAKAGPGKGPITQAQQRVVPAAAPPAPAPMTALPTADEVVLPPASIEADQLDLGSGAHPSLGVAPRPIDNGPVLASAAPDFAGSLGATRSGPSRTGDQVLLEFLTGKVGLLTAEQANAVRGKAESDNLPIDAVAVGMGLITEEQLVNSLSQETWVPHLKVDKYEIRKKALDTIPREDAQHFGVFPVDKLGNLLTLAMINPLDVEAIRQLEAKTGLDIKKVVATRSEVGSAIDRYYGGKVLASEGSRSFSQEVSEAPRSPTQMLARSVEAPPAPAPAPPASIIPIAAEPTVPHDISADIQDIDDLLGGEETIAPAILEPISIQPEESNDALELQDAAIAPAAAPAHESDVEFGLHEAPKGETGALARSELDLPTLDMAKTDAIEPPPVATSAVPTTPAHPVPATTSRPLRPGVARPATARISASGVRAAGKTANLVPVLEEEFRYAISHGKAKVFERWIALQTRNRIVNAVQVERELDGVLVGLYAERRKAG